MISNNPLYVVVDESNPRAFVLVLTDDIGIAADKVINCVTNKLYSVDLGEVMGFLKKVGIARHVEVKA